MSKAKKSTKTSALGIRKTKKPHGPQHRHGPFFWVWWLLLSEGQIQNKRMRETLGIDDRRGPTAILKRFAAAFPGVIQYDRHKHAHFYTGVEPTEKGGDHYPLELALITKQPDRYSRQSAFSMTRGCLGTIPEPPPASPRVLLECSRAIARQEKLVFDACIPGFGASSGRPRSRELTPLRLFDIGSRWVLLAFDPTNAHEPAQEEAPLHATAKSWLTMGQSTQAQTYQENDDCLVKLELHGSINVSRTGQTGPLPPSGLLERHSELNLRPAGHRDRDLFQRIAAHDPKKSEKLKVPPGFLPETLEAWRAEPDHPDDALRKEFNQRRR